MIITSGLTNQASASTATEITLGSCATEIGANAFSGCSNLSGFTIPSGVTSIGDSAFKDCSGFIRINVEPETPPTLGTNAFDGSDCNIYVPIGSYEEYISSWSAYDDRITYEGNSYKVSLKNSQREKLILCNNSATITREEVDTKYFSGITETTIGECVTSIGDSAFYSYYDNVRQYGNVTIPSGVTSIGNDAFYNEDLENSSLNGILDIPSSVIKIGSNAFRGNYEIESIYIRRNTPPTLGSSAFTGTNCFIHVPQGKDEIYLNAENWSYYSERIISPDTCYKALFYGNIDSSYRPDLYCNFERVIKCDDNTVLSGINNNYDYRRYTTNVVIGNTVTDLYNSVFESFGNLTSVTFDEGSQLTTIGYGAFSSCRGLTSINIPRGVTSIDTNTFQYNTSLSSVTFDEGSQLSTIGNYAFQHCRGLTNINIPSGVTKIYNYTFDNCISLPIENDIRYAGNCAVKVLNSGLTECSFREGTRILGDNLFGNGYGTVLSSVTFPNSLETIGSEDFSGLEGLTSINIPSSVKYIYDSAFYRCTSLSSVTFNEGSQLTTIGNSAFSSCYGLTNINIPSGVISIGDGAFSNIQNLSSVTINSITPPTIGDYTFEPNSKILTIYVPCQSVQAYREAWPARYAAMIEGIPPCDAPLVAGKLISKYSDGRKYSINSCGNNSYIGTNDTRPSGYDLSAMTSTVIGSCVTSVTNSSYSGCTSLSSVTFNEGSQLETIGINAFSGCSSLSSINIPNSVSTIGTYVFMKTSLTEFELGSGVTSIGVGCLAYTPVSRITVDSNNSTYDSRNNCNAIVNTNENKLIIGCKNTVIDNSIESIAERAFLGCSGLTSLTIPSSVTEIGTYAFTNCSGLTSITVNATTPPALGATAFNNTNTSPIYVPSDSVDAYKAANRWSDLADRIFAIPS